MMNRQPVANRFIDRVAIVTGGAAGIGRAIVEELIKEGAAVLFVDLDDDQGQALASALVSAQAGALFYRGDVSDEQVCHAAVEAAFNDPAVKEAMAKQGNTINVIDKPQHPYVQLLVDSVPVPDPDIKWNGEINLPTEEEMRSSVHSGCRFYPRCPARMDRCLTAQPPLYKIDKIDHEASCYLYDQNEVAVVATNHR